ncbi:MAG: T9SS type A sorting domain-containing protein [Bacteroidota bacterium]
MNLSSTIGLRCLIGILGMCLAFFPFYSLPAQSVHCEYLEAENLCDSVPCATRKIQVMAAKSGQDLLLVNSPQLPDGAINPARLHLLRSTADTTHHWGVTNQLVSPFTLRNQENPLMAESALGEVYIAWTEDSSFLARLFVQKLDQNRKEVWRPQGIQLAHQVRLPSSTAPHPFFLIPDQTGGVYVVWKNFALNPITSLDTQRIAIQYIDANGGRWNPPLMLGHRPGEFHATLADNGELLVAWTEWNGPFPSVEDIHANRVDQAARLKWGPEGKVISDSADFNQYSPFLISDGKNGVFVAWAKPDPNNGRETAIQRLDPQGNRMLPFRSPSFRPMLNASRAVHVVKAEVGAFWMFVEGNLYKIDSLGNRTIQVATTYSPDGDFYVGTVDVQPNGAGGVYVLYEDNFNKSRLMQVNPDGSYPFGQKEVLVYGSNHFITKDITEQRLQVLRKGGVKVFFRNSTITPLIHLRHVLPDGSLNKQFFAPSQLTTRDTFVVQGAPVSLKVKFQAAWDVELEKWTYKGVGGNGFMQIPANSIIRVDGEGMIVKAGEEDAIYQVYTEYRFCWDTSNQVLVKVHEILEEPEENDDLTVHLHPNPVSDELTLSLNLGHTGPLSILITDLTGRLILERNYELNLGIHELKLPLGDLQAGYYFIRTSTPRQTRSQVLLKQ